MHCVRSLIHLLTRCSFLPAATLNYTFDSVIIDGFVFLFKEKPCERPFYFKLLPLEGN